LKAENVGYEAIIRKPTNDSTRELVKREHM
jgi:hypothetical protein